jgi:hypothetical protein
MRVKLAADAPDVLDTSSKGCLYREMPDSGLLPRAGRANLELALLMGIALEFGWERFCFFPLLGLSAPPHWRLPLGERTASRNAL